MVKKLDIGEAYFQNNVFFILVSPSTKLLIVIATFKANVYQIVFFSCFQEFYFLYCSQEYVNYYTK